MSIEFECTACGRQYSVKDELAGKWARCGCGARIQIPILLEEADFLDIEPARPLPPSDHSQFDMPALKSNQHPAISEGHVASGDRWLDSTASIVGALACGAFGGALCASVAILEQKNFWLGGLGWQFATLFGGAVVGILAASILIVFDNVRARAKAGQPIHWLPRLFFARGHLSTLLWIATPFALAIAYVWIDTALLGPGRPVPSTAGDQQAAQLAPRDSQTLLDARHGFTTRLIPSSYKREGPAPDPPSGVFNKVHYQSDVGELVAYVTPDPGDGQRHPAVLWAHGGFGGIGDTFWQPASWRNDQSAAVFRKAGLVLMCPSWRGENDNAGHFEMFYGEVNDLLAAADYLATLPYVDHHRIYLAGHSTGGTLVLLAVAAGGRFRAAFSFGGAPDIERVVSDGAGYGNTPFDMRIQQEAILRSAVNYTGAIRTPTFYFEGINSSYCSDARRMEVLAKRSGVPFTACIISGGDHFNILQCISAAVAERILQDSGEKCNISITPAEMNRRFADVAGPFFDRRRQYATFMPAVKFTPAACAKVRSLIERVESTDEIPGRSRPRFRDDFMLLRYEVVITNSTQGCDVEVARFGSFPRAGTGIPTRGISESIRYTLYSDSSEPIRGYLLDYNADEDRFTLIDYAAVLAERHDGQFNPSYLDDYFAP